MLALTAMLIVFAPAAFAQSAPTVTGTVTDQSGQPVIGATIIEQGTTNGATTGVDGSYSLKLRGGGNSANLIFQSLGFVSQTVAVNGRTKIDVKLAEDAVALDAVVAIGYGTVKQKDLTTAVSVVKTDDLARRPITSASGALQGKAAGVQVIQPNGSPGQGTTGTRPSAKPTRPLPLTRCTRPPPGRSQPCWTPRWAQTNCPTTPFLTPTISWTGSAVWLPSPKNRCMTPASPRRTAPSC